jgi:molybdopterin-binding protein
MKVGARNKLVAYVTDIKRGGVMGQVKVTLGNTDGLGMSSVMTLDSIEEMDLKVGDEVEVVVKAINVLLLKR